jgi:uncharacterized protein (DUF1501 family)
MKPSRKTKPRVTHRTKGDKAPPRKAGKLGAHPAMGELSRLVRAGDLDRGRTLAYLKRKQP